MEELLSNEFVCPKCQSVEISQSLDDVQLDDGMYLWYCLSCGWVGREHELCEKELPL